MGLRARAFRNLNLETVIRAATINSFMSLKIKASIGPPGIYNLYVLGYPKISKYIHNASKSSVASSTNSFTEASSYLRLWIHGLPHQRRDVFIKYLNRKEETIITIYTPNDLFMLKDEEKRPKVADFCALGIRRTNNKQKGNRGRYDAVCYGLGHADSILQRTSTVASDRAIDQSNLNALYSPIPDYLPPVDVACS
ncbi:hypothetical protein NQ317_003590 [Molorchus minor]|uniref:Uncharacterized protein n=1 Tax=Molorchus minor TaxID=1323400 RepID=A0ABQ9JEW9_9CUCU|nr:hypothetical protein NQ317_003590 [Molorchus minor]